MVLHSGVPGIDSWLWLLTPGSCKNKCQLATVIAQVMSSGHVCKKLALFLARGFSPDPFSHCRPLGVNHQMGALPIFQIHKIKQNLKVNMS